MARLTRKDMQQQTRERLLAAARTEIARLGIEAASIRGIAQAAGYSLGAFYSNFDSKDAMLRDLLDSHMREEVRTLRAIVARTESHETGEMLAEVARWWHDVYSDSTLSAIGVEFYVHAARNPSFRREFEKAKARRLSECAKALKALFARRGLKPDLGPHEMAEGFSALWMGFALQESGSRSETSDRVALVFLKALLQSAAPAEPRGARSGTPCRR